MSRTDRQNKQQPAFAQWQPSGAHNSANAADGRYAQNAQATPIQQGTDARSSEQQWQSTMQTDGVYHYGAQPYPATSGSPVPQQFQQLNQPVQYQQSQAQQGQQPLQSQAQLAGTQMYAQPQQQGKPPKKKRSVALWIAIIVALLCIAAAAFLYFTMFGGSTSSRAGAPGQLTNKTPEEIQAELDRQVEEGMFNISIASVVQFANGSSEGELRIENVPGNRYLMTVEITLDSTGQVVYESGIIEPNFHIQSDRLSTTLTKGSYPATATFTALDPDTEEEIGTAAAKITIDVLS